MRSAYQGYSLFFISQKQVLMCQVPAAKVATHAGPDTKSFWKISRYPLTTCWRGFSKSLEHKQQSQEKARQQSEETAKQSQAEAAAVGDQGSSCSAQGHDVGAILLAR
jgi:hypothetical protein